MIMQRIQDKDLDRLFRDTLADAEMPAPINSWEAIEAKLQKPTRTKFPIFWLAAVSMSALLITTLLFNKEEKIQLHLPAMAAVKTLPTSVVQAQKIIESAPPIIQASASINVKVAQPTVLNKDSVKIYRVEKPVNETMMAQVPIKRVEKQVEVQPTAVVDEPVYAQADVSTLTTDDISEISDTQSSKGIRNVGDLINLVVGKVDKRDKKLLRFNTIDDESSLVGFNLGFLKFNSKKHK